MELFEYIKSQLPQMPNTVIMKQLGASQELIDYVKETPENTNFAIAEVVGGSGGGDVPGDIGEVWLIGNEYQDDEYGRIFILSNADTTDYITELFTNSDNYQVFLNGEELPYRKPLHDSDMESIIWSDNEVDEAETKYINITSFHGSINVNASFVDISTAPTSVEVSVKAK